MASLVDLHPERRRKSSRERSLTDTSKSLMPSRTRLQRDQEDDDNDDSREEQSNESDANPAIYRRQKRQMTIDVSKGRLSNKKPLKNPITRDDSRRSALKLVAEETQLVLPGLLLTRPDVLSVSYRCGNENIDHKFCPGLPAIQIQVVDMDTIDAALAFQQKSQQLSSGRPVAVLNMANASTAGGGWKHGALAQEESICYRTSLSRTFKRANYPIPEDAVTYAPTVMVIRDNIKDGHNLLDCTNPSKLKVITVISGAAVCQPSTKKTATGTLTYALAKDKRLMLDKMRLVLRTAIRRQHRQLILGAFGCGAFGNPNQEVAAMWKSVLREQEFGGGWWEDIVFAVMAGDGSAKDNFVVFTKELHGLALN